MKFYCQSCGVHFPKEFEKTLKPPCNFWGQMGMSNLPKEYKKKVWDWVFSLPVDEIALKFKIGIGISLSSQPVSGENDFIKMIPGYEKMSEKEQQEAQRKYFKDKTKEIKQTMTEAEVLQNAVIAGKTQHE